jgi:hypothetical protein
MTFPLIAGNSGRDPVFANMASAALELVDHRAFDDRVLLVEYLTDWKRHPTGLSPDTGTGSDAPSAALDVSGRRDDRFSGRGRARQNAGQVRPGVC